MEGCAGLRQPNRRFQKGFLDHIEGSIRPCKRGSMRSATHAPQARAVGLEQRSQAFLIPRSRASEQARLLIRLGRGRFHDL